MAYAYESNDGLCKSNNASFIHTYNEIGKKMEDEEKLWVASLKEQGVKAAHPDDGWVDRKNNTVLLQYPQFDNGVEVGDTIALGGSCGKTSLVRVTALMYSPLVGVRYTFEPIEPEKKPRWWGRLLYHLSIRLDGRLRK